MAPVDTIRLTIQWLDNLEQAIGLERLLDSMPNNFRGRLALLDLLAGLQEPGEIRLGSVVRSLSNPTISGLVTGFEQRADQRLVNVRAGGGLALLRLEDLELISSSGAGYSHLFKPIAKGE